ncbi:DNA methyltransferase [Mesorhizobium australicum]|uniref:site-specific DNA-methyltransferase (adenine-specific) n=1 Tax=Mesorhizobium australicum TaxID=536018 RepID=A0A1X7PJ71_9HYPH|nr:DNA methyltransferase [Mesorhizobium australicum]SMH50973.1 DNA methylase [Mesorhizobium australicum]
MTAHPNLSSGITESLAAFSGFGRPTEIVARDGLTYFVNEFWTARQRQSSSLHEISYRACFKAELPRFFIERLTEPGDLVYDPFMGRGTTPLEAALLGRRAAGNDVNPLSAMLVGPRLSPPTLEEVGEALAAIDLDAEAESNPDLLAFYHPDTLRQIAALRAWLLVRADRLTRAEQWIRMVAINRLTGHSSGFFSVYTLPPNQAVSVASQRRINAKRSQTPPRRDVVAIILRKSASLLAGPLPSPAEPPLLMTGRASHTPALLDASAALAITSPPFLDVVDYAGDNWLRCWFAGIDPRMVAIDHHRTVAEWTGFVRATLAELARVVRPGGHVAFEVGEVRGGKVLLERHVAEAAEGLPLDFIGVIVNDQAFTKTANCWGVGNNSRGTNTNRICLFRRR